MKKRSDFSRLMGYAGNYRYFTYASWVLSAVSALVALVPFVYIWKILRDVLNAAPDYAQAVNIPHYGWMAVLFAVLSYLIYIAALMCSHLSAFRVATNLRLAVSEHLAVLPLGFAENFGSGKLRKIIHESTGAAETYLAHQLPDQYNAIATPVGLLVLLLAFDWRLGLLSLAPVVLAFLIMATMTGKRMVEKMRQYGNALEAMSNEAVEYVRGIPVVKTFGQSVFSFKKFKATIDEYEKWVISYTKDLRLPMMFYTAAVNGVFAFLIAGGLLFTTHGVTPEFLLNLLFYIIITPVISLTLTRIMYMSENKMVVADALARIDSVLEAAPMQVQAVPQHPKDSSVTLRDVHFSYDGKTEVIKGVSLDIQPGQTVAFVGPSGGGKSTLANLVCRFFDVQSGSVRVGGADVRAIPKEERMDTISFVFQNSRLLKGSILDNVRLGRPQATEAEVLAALKAAQCMDIVEKFPAGIHTVIGTKGVYLSGGEQQRIAIARAMLKNAPILILDEATAFADPDNEAKVQAAFAQLAKGKTVLMIAHRLSTVASGVMMQLSEIFNAMLQLRRMKAIEQEPAQEGATAFQSNGHDICFNHVGFWYQEGEDVLSDVTFTAKQGEVTALVGPSGGGKSTTAKLAARFWDIQKGTITMGGVDISTVDPETLLKDYAIVFQDVVLFNDTIMGNIRLGRKDATDEEVMAAARAAQCDEFVQRLPEGYQTVVGENGSTLSGGERQRISIARALLKNAPIVLLDEATASLDVENETSLQTALSALLKDKTVLVIAHRMRTVMGADHVVVLADGHVAEEGTPEQLMERGGMFRHMVELQRESSNWQVGGNGGGS